MRALRRFDDAVYAFERFLVVLLLALMTAAVFADTVLRIFNEPRGRIATLLVRAGVPDATASPLATAIFLVLAIGVTYAAIRTRDRVEPMPPRRAFLTAIAIAVGTWLAIRVTIFLLPYGLIWSQRMALSFMLWIGFLGASIATRDHAHIVFEVADRIWPKRVQPVIRVITRVVPAAFAFFLAVLAFGHTRYHYGDWLGGAGVFDAFAVPRFVVYGFLVFPFLMMTLRFLLHGVASPEIEPLVPESQEAAP